MRCTRFRRNSPRAGKFLLSLNPRTLSGNQLDAAVRPIPATIAADARKSLPLLCLKTVLTSAQSLRMSIRRSDNCDPSGLTFQIGAMKTADVLITGATGFIGSAVARKLVEAGFTVRALMRPSSRRAHIADLDLEPCEGDLRDEGSIKNAMRGVRYVFHLAADYRLWARYPHEIFSVNVAGTRAIMREALRTGVERVIYTSSVATLALRADGGVADESVSLPEQHAIGTYKRSKIAA